jgi:hypothetical protein
MEDVASTSEIKPVTRNIKKKYIIGDADIAAWRPNMEIKNPLVDGLSMLIFVFIGYNLFKL